MLGLLAEMRKESGFVLFMSDLLCSCLRSRQRVREKIERDKAERAKKVGDWEEPEDDEVGGSGSFSGFRGGKGGLGA